MQLPIYYLHFFIKKFKVNPQGKRPVWLRITINNKKLEMSTGQYIQSEDWDVKKQGVSVESADAHLNLLLETIRSEINNLITEIYITERRISIESVRNALRDGSGSNDHSLIEVAAEHNQKYEKLVGIKYAWGSYKNYRSTMRFLKEFIPYQYDREDVPLKEVNNNFCENYFIWLTTVKKTSRQNGANKHIQRLKTLVNYAYKMGYIDSNPIRDYSLSFNVPARTALTWDEINKIATVNLETNTLNKVRDIFLFMVWTGLSYSDVKKLSNEHIYRGVDQKLWLKMERTKTKSTFAFPLLSPAISILNKYSVAENSQEVFPVLSNQKMNFNLKKIQTQTGILKNLHTHLPRHTFATTITLQNGISLESVSKMLGHSKITVTQIYARVGEVKISEEMGRLEEKLFGDIRHG